MSNTQPVIQSITRGQIITDQATYTLHRKLFGLGNIHKITGPNTDLNVHYHWTDGSLDKVIGCEDGRQVQYKVKYDWAGNFKELTRKEV